MSGRHKSPTLSWHPPAELSPWARAEAERRDLLSQAGRSVVGPSTNPRHQEAS